MIDGRNIHLDARHVPGKRTLSALGPLVQAPGPGLTVVLLTFMVLAQGGGVSMHTCTPRAVYKFPELPIIAIQVFFFHVRLAHITWQ